MSWSWQGCGSVLGLLLVLGCARTEPPPSSVEAAQPGIVRGPPTPPAPTSAQLLGIVQVEAWRHGPIRIDIFDGDQRKLGGKRPSVVAVAELDQPGPFELRVERSVDRIWIGAYVDEDGDGKPSVGEPNAWYHNNPVMLEEKVEGIELNLERIQAPPPEG